MVADKKSHVHKRKRKSVAQRNETSSLSVTDDAPPLSSSSEEKEPSTAKKIKRKISQKKRNCDEKTTSQKESKIKLNSLWQNPQFKSQLYTKLTELAEERKERSPEISESTLDVEASEVETSLSYKRRNHNDVDSCMPVPTGKHKRYSGKVLPKKKRKIEDKPPVDQALVLVHNQIVSLESRFQRDLHELENIYATNYYKPLLELRNKLLDAAKRLSNKESDSINYQRVDQRIPHATRGMSSGSSSSQNCPNDTVHPSSGPCVGNCDAVEKCAELFLYTKKGMKDWNQLSNIIYRISKAMETLPVDENLSQLPHQFWLHVLQRSEPMLCTMLTKHDSNVLVYLRDIKSKLFSIRWPINNLKSKTGAKRKHPPFMKSADYPEISTRHSLSLPSQSSQREAELDAVLDPSSRSKAKQSESCYSTSKKKISKQSEKSDDAIGFDLMFEFYPNPHIKNTILTKRYIIDVSVQEDDYVSVKRYKTFQAVKKANSKTDVSSDGGDEASDSGSCFKHHQDNKNNKTRASQYSHRFHRMLDYKGPRLVAVEGSTVRWRKRKKNREDNVRAFRNRPWFTLPSEFSSKDSSLTDIGVRDTSFFDFFGWNWDLYRNRIMSNDGYIKQDIKPYEVREIVYKDYEVGTYIRDVVIPRAFAIYRSCKRKFLKMHCRSSDSMLDSVSPCDSLPKLNPGNYENVTLNIPQEPHPALLQVFSKPSQPMEPVIPAPVEIHDPSETVIEQDRTKNYARDYDDVDDVLVLKQPPDTETHTGKTNTTAEKEITDPSATSTNSLTQSRRKVSQVVKNVNNIIKKVNATKAFQRPLVNYEPMLGTPLTGGINNHFIPDVRDTIHTLRVTHYQDESDIPNSEHVSNRGVEADDENNFTDLDPPSVNRAFENIRGQFRQGMWNKCAEKTKVVTKAPTCLVPDRDDEILSSVHENKERVSFRQTTPFPSDDNVQVDDSDVISTSGASSPHGDGAETPSSSDCDLSAPDECPCDLAILDEHYNGKKSGILNNKHLFCKKLTNAPQCSTGSVIKNGNGINESKAANDAEDNELSSLDQISDADSEAPQLPAPDVRTCKQQ